MLDIILSFGILVALAVGLSIGYLWGRVNAEIHRSAAIEALTARLKASEEALATTIKQSKGE